jgi:hypothetical protein
MNHFTVRRARVQPEFAHLYPEIVPDVWMSAPLATHLVRKRGPREVCKKRGCAGGRVLCEAHFEFRGGTRRPKYLAGACVRRLTPAFAILAIA